MDEKTINKDFKTSIYMGMESLTEEEILKILQSKRSIYLDFKRAGLIHSRNYSFITKVTFGVDKKSSLEESKTDEEIEQARRNLKIVEDYFNNQSSLKTYKLAFAERCDSECAIYNQNRYVDYDSLNKKLQEIFN